MTYEAKPVPSLTSSADELTILCLLSEEFVSRRPVLEIVIDFFNYSKSLDITKRLTGLLILQDSNLKKQTGHRVQGVPG
jgi:hypothetical protein